MTPIPRTSTWNWSVCVVLLFATLLMYMDRMTVTQLSKEIVTEFHLTETQYGRLEAVFSYAFAFGALLTGFLADRWNVWWLYPTVVFAWSLAGAATGLVPAGQFVPLLLCRFALGFAEAGHWPCALRTTQRLFPPDQRTLANSILQSGAAVGAILTPLIILWLMAAYNSWRLPFVIIGGFGLGWVLVWFLLVRPQDMANTQAQNTPLFAGVWDDFLKPLLCDRRFYVLVVFAICINNAWHFFRVWLPRILDRTYGFDQTEVQWFSSAYYAAADLGSLALGYTSLWLVRRGVSVHNSRVSVITVCGFLTTLCMLPVLLPEGTRIYPVFLVIGFGGLGLFPPLYSLTQELSNKHQGKVTGVLGFLIWMAMAPQREIEGYFADITGTYYFGLTLAGCSPLIGVLILILFWPRTRLPDTPSPSAVKE